MNNINNELNNLMRFEFVINPFNQEYFHEEIKLVYVFEGTLEIRIGQETYVLVQDDFLIINSNKPHVINSLSKTLIGFFSVSAIMLRQIMTQRHTIFWCNSTLDKSSAYDEVRKVIKGIVNIFFHQKGAGKIHLIGQYYEILYLMTKYFLVSDIDTFKEQSITVEEARLEKITEYVSENFQNKISLSELAEQMYLSETYLSKYIKKQLGMNFLEYLNNVRLNHIIDGLIYSDKSITRIALENGFNNIGTFNRVFKSKYQMTPHDYRKQIKKNNSETRQSENNKELEKSINEYILLHPVSEEFNEPEIIIVEADCNQEGELLNKAWGKMINVGTASDLLRSTMQNHIREITRRLRYKYIRIWDLYSSEMYIDINSKNQYYNFDKLDTILDFVVEEGLIPYLELNIKPKILIRSVEELLIDESDRIRFDSMENVAFFMEGLILHLIDRYGTEIVENWYLEIWKDETDQTINVENKINNYLRLFDSVAKIIRKFLPNVKIGGAGLSLRYGNDSFRAVLSKWKNIESQPDFISLYSFPYVMGESERMKVNKISIDKEFFPNYINAAKEIMSDLGYEEVDIHVSEWSSTVSNRNILNDSCHKGAYIMKNLIATSNTVNTIGYWFASDVFASYFDSNELLNGSCGLLSKDGIPKPAYFAIEFMNRLGSKIIDKGENYIVTDTGYNEIRIAAHNYKFFNHRYYMMQEDEVDLKNFDLLFEDVENKIIKYVLQVKVQGEYEIKIHAINRKYGSLQDEWIRMACPRNLIKEDINYIKQVCVPRLSIMNIESEGKELTFLTQLEPNEIQLIQVKHKK